MIEVIEERLLSKENTTFQGTLRIKSRACYVRFKRVYKICVDTCPTWTRRIQLIGRGWHVQMQDPKVWLYTDVGRFSILKKWAFLLCQFTVTLHYFTLIFNCRKVYYRSEASRLIDSDSQSDGVIIIFYTHDIDAFYALRRLEATRMVGSTGRMVSTFGESVFAWIDFASKWCTHHTMYIHIMWPCQHVNSVSPQNEMLIFHPKSTTTMDHHCNWASRQQVKMKGWE